MYETAQASKHVILLPKFLTNVPLNNKNPKKALGAYEINSCEF